MQHTTRSESMSTVIFTDKTVKTRKAHHCNWCGELIKAGESVPFIKGIFEGNMFSAWMHEECQHACNRSDVSEEGYVPFENQRGVSWGEE